MLPKFLIRRTSPNPYVQGVVPAVAAVIGTAFQITTKDPDTGLNTMALAQGTRKVPAFFVTKQVRVGAGLTDTELAFENSGMVTYPSGEIMTPFEAGQMASYESALGIEVEDPDNLLTTGTGAVLTTTPIGADITFRNGKFALGVTGDFCEWKLVAQMTVQDSTAGTVRVYLEKNVGAIQL